MNKRFNIKYLVVALLLFLVETSIAILHFNPFVRGFLGDILVIPLIYTFLRVFLKTNYKKLALGVLLFAYAVELLQFFKLVELLSIQSKILRIILGSVFDPYDFIAYTLGFLLILLIEKFFHKNENPQNISL